MSVLVSMITIWGFCERGPRFGLPGPWTPNSFGAATQRCWPSGAIVIWWMKVIPSSLISPIFFLVFQSRT